MTTASSKKRGLHAGGLRPSTRRQLFAVTFLVIFVLLLWQIIVILRPFFSPIVWAVLLAAATYPVYRRLRRAIGNRANAAAAIMTVGVLIAAVLPAVYGMILAGQQGMEAYDRAAAWLKAGHQHDVGAALAALPGIGRISQEVIGQAIVTGSGRVEQSLLEGGKAVSTFVLSQSVDFATNALMLLTDFLVMLFTLFFVFRDGEHAYRSFYRAIPLESTHKAKMFDRLKSTLKAVVRGTLLTALAQGVTAGVTYYLLGIPFAVFLGVLSGILAFLPVGGTALVWGPLAAYLVLSGSFLEGVILLVVGAGLVGLMDNLLKPILVGVEAHLPVLPLFFASLGGLAYFGVLGLFIGPILLAVVMETFAIYQEEYQQQGSDVILTLGPDVPPASEAGGIRGEISA